MIDRPRAAGSPVAFRRRGWSPSVGLAAPPPLDWRTPPSAGEPATLVVTPVLPLAAVERRPAAVEEVVAELRADGEVFGLAVVAAGVL